MSKKNFLVAKVYAKTAFSLAQNESERDLWSSFLQKLARLLAHRDIQDWLDGDQRTSLTDRVSLLMDSLKISDGAVANNFKAFLHTLLSNKRYTLASDIAETFSQLIAQSNRVLQVVLEVARLPDPSQSKEMESFVRRVVPSDNLSISYVEMPSLIAGFNVRVGDRVLRASLHHDINHLFSLAAK